MFKRKWPNKIISDEGYEIQIESRGTIIYREKNKIIKANSELLVGKEGILLYRNSLAKWSSQSGGGSIFPEKSNEIENNIKAALAFYGMKINII